MYVYIYIFFFNFTHMHTYRRRVQESPIFIRIIHICKAQECLISSHVCYLTKSRAQLSSLYVICIGYVCVCVRVYVCVCMCVCVCVCVCACLRV